MVLSKYVGWCTYTHKNAYIHISHRPHVWELRMECHVVVWKMALAISDKMLWKLKLLDYFLPISSAFPSHFHKCNRICLSLTKMVIFHLVLYYWLIPISLPLSHSPGKNFHFFLHLFSFFSLALHVAATFIQLSLSLFNNFMHTEWRDGNEEKKK